MSKPRLTDQDYCRAAKRLGCDAAAVAAVAEQESLQAGFDSEGRPTILFERHIFHKLTRGKYDRSHPGISNATPGGYGPSAAQHGRFTEAFALDPQAAMQAASWGKFQILGKNYLICGFSSVDAFVDAMKDSEARQLDAFCAFVLHEGLDAALTDHDWTTFADGYNGSAQRKHHYDSLIAAKFAHWQHHDFGCSDQKESAAALPGAVDTSTEDASGSSQPSDPTSNEQSPAIQNAENITNVSTGDKTVPDNFVAEDKTVDAPPAEASTQKAAVMTIGGFAVPACLVGFIHAVQSLISNGYLDTKTIGDAVLNFIQSNTKFVFAGLGLVITSMMLKKLYKQVTLWLQMYFAARADMHNVTVKPQ